MLRDLGAATALRYVVLRYFNVAGSDPGGRIGQSTLKATLLTKVACEAAVGKRPHVSIFGTDYPTPDGTGVRDYIHVEDLADAHLQALDYLRRGGASATLNCGYGHGYSVREVIATVDRLNGQPLKTIEAPRRAGDPPSLVAKAERVRQVSAGRRGMTTWKPSCARSWNGSAGCSRSRNCSGIPRQKCSGAAGLRRAAQAARLC